MARGQLRVYLGSAPGVGKTYRMLDEGWRRRQRGTDVVIGYVETHDRPFTAAQLRELEVVPRVKREYRGAQFEEMDLDAVLARKPQVVLVDELAHTNAPGSTNAKRWQDVDALLDAGIDVITTVNIQHVESVNDVVEKITGITQQETVPDAVVRRAEQVELVDITPEALRRRMAHGNIYKPDKIDISLSNYFRVGNLSALRELALLWLADRVEDALQRYLTDHDIGETWETRERLIVGVTGTELDEALLRRAARIASRTGAELIAVHVVDDEALNATPADTSMARELAKEFEGQFQQIVADDIATALVNFAHSERGTQIVLGASRPRRAYHLSNGLVENVLRRAQDLDVHIIAVGGTRPVRVHTRRRMAQFSWRRQAFGLGVTLAVMPLLTVAMATARSSISLSTAFLVYLVAVLGLTTWSGAVVGIVAALAASALENFYFVQPIHTLAVARPDDVVALVANLLFATGASVVVSRFAQRSNEADRARAEAEILSNAIASVEMSHEELLPLLDSLRVVFGASSVALLKADEGDWSADLTSGEPLLDPSSGERFDIDERHALVLTGVSLEAHDRRLVEAFTKRIAAGLGAVGVLRDATELRVVAEAEALRIRHLRTMADDLEAPLAALPITVSSLLAKHGGEVSADFRDALVAIEGETRRLDGLVRNLVDVGRLETGFLEPQSVRTSLLDLLDDALSNVDLRGRTLDLDIPDDLPELVTDPELVTRAIAIVVGNACRFSPLDRPVRIAAGARADVLEIIVIDQGPGIPAARRTTTGATTSPREVLRDQSDLGLTVARGFVELLGGQFRFEDTPGGGLTVVVELPRNAGSS